MRLLRSPIAVFLGIGLVTAGIILFGTNKLADRAASDEAIAEARRTTQLLAQGIVGPELPPQLVFLSPDNANRYLGTLDRFDKKMLARLGDATERPYRINIWSADGRLIYSSELSVLLNTLEERYRLDLDADQRDVLANGGVGSETANPARPQDAAATGTDGMVRIYTRYVLPEPKTSDGHQGKIAMRAAGKPVLFEAYFTLDELGQRRSQIFDSFRWITVGGLALLIAAATFILLGLSRELRRASTERERLLRSAMQASDAERRRIARDLHDSVVQDLAGTAFAITAVSRQPETDPSARATLDDAGTALRGSLKALRSLLAEIHPPDLNAEGLAAALADLIAPAGVAGIQASVSVEGTETISNERAALVWRVAQEAVRNAIRHSQASTIAVTVRGDHGRLTLEVVDDGIGFDPRGPRDAERYGLRGLRSLVVDSGGTLDVRSSAGDGTTVQMEVDAQ